MGLFAVYGDDDHNDNDGDGDGEMRTDNSGFAKKRTV